MYNTIKFPAVLKIISRTLKILTVNPKQLYFHDPLTLSSQTGKTA